MKCPKCGYLGFETTDRCRNCGYDFSLSANVQTPELPLRGDETEAPLADFEIKRPTPSATPRDLDLDRVIGGDVDEEPSLEPPSPSAGPPSLPATSVPFGRDGGRQEGRRSPAGDGGRREGRRSPASDEPSLIGAPRPAPPPLAVRRSTPEVTRGRNRTAPRYVRRDEPTLALEPETEGTRSGAGGPPVSAVAGPGLAGAGARILAALIDGLLLLGINVAVVYFTLAVTGLTRVDLVIIPPIPMGAFLLLLTGGYLIAFTAASGQTIGKMITGIRVEGDDGQRVGMAEAVLRVGGMAISVLTLGIGFLPALFGARRRALHDRLARTQVVTVR